MKYSLITSPWKNEFVEEIGTVENELLIASPFVNSEGVRILSEAVSEKESINLSLITNMNIKNLISGFTDPAALLKLYENFGHVKISSLGRLHAKVYIIDSQVSIITSANLTGGGLFGNFEYGILIEDRETVSSIREDMLKYYHLGNIFEKSLLEEINKEVNGIREVRKARDELVKNPALEKMLRKHEDKIEYDLLKNRIKDGRSINSIFSETILYVLKKEGPLSTKELHPFIQAIHPDICDDSIDRIIDGQHFGKKWKHLVRDAQQSLKKKGLIYLKDGKWYISD